MFNRKKGFYKGEYVFEQLSKNAPILQKQNKKNPAQPEAPFMNRPEFVNAPHPTRSQKS